MGLADLLDLFPNQVAGILRSSSRPLSLSSSSSSLPTSVAALDTEVLVAALDRRLSHTIRRRHQIWLLLLRNVSEHKNKKQQATQEELTVSTRSSGLSCFVGFVECHSNFVLRDGVFVVGLEGGLLTFRPVLLPDLFDVLGVATLRVDLPLDDEGTESVFVWIVPLFSALWWHRRIYEGLRRFRD